MYDELNSQIRAIRFEKPCVAISLELHHPYVSPHYKTVPRHFEMKLKQEVDISFKDIST